MKCNRCNKDHDGNFGSGIYCSRSCANVRNHNDTIKNKIALSVKNHYQSKEKKQYDYTCEKCNNQFKHSMIRNGRKIHCSNCKRKVIKFKVNVTSILDFSKRTVHKILNRAGMAKCSICKWDEASCDIHHIIPKKIGGTNSHDNLVILCPNCHRKAHCGKIPQDKLKELNLYNIFTEWEKYYNI